MGLGRLLLRSVRVLLNLRHGVHLSMVERLEMATSHPGRQGAVLLLLLRQDRVTFGSSAFPGNESCLFVSFLPPHVREDGDKLVTLISMKNSHFYWTLLYKVMKTKFNKRYV